MLRVVFALLCSGFAGALAADVAVIPLWESRQDLEETFIGPKDTERRVRNVTNPTLNVYLADRSSGTGVIVAPGGGFRHLAIDKEGTDVAKWLNGIGVSAFVLKYSAGSDPSRDTVIERSMADLLQAMKIVRTRSAEWKLDAGRIGVMGFSAGGYLAVQMAVRPKDELRPAFTIPIYPAAPKNLVVPADAPPAFFAAANDDAMTPDHAIPLYAAWAKAKRPASLHVFSTGGHGFGIRKIGAASDQWTARLEDWMGAQGLLSKP